MFTFPTAPHPHPKERQIATLNNKVYNINYSSRKSSNNVSAKHICTAIRACESLLLPERLFLWQDLYGVSTNAAPPLKCYVPHVCARLTGYRSCFHMLWPTPQNALATSLQVSWKKKKNNSGEARHLTAIILSPLCPLRCVPHNPHTTNSHDSSHWSRVYVMSLPHFRQHTSL